ncbi:MAG: hypothetical protein DSY42_07910 [Aquifex sp.]|nr:MAG: hypothetical protein DSY42_07910 [Aquifex sp.]
MKALFCFNCVALEVAYAQHMIFKVCYSYEITETKLKKHTGRGSAKFEYPFFFLPTVAQS